MADWKQDLEKLQQDVYSRIEDATSTFDSQVNRGLGFTDNKYVSPVLTILLVVYAGMAAPKLHKNAEKLFDNTWFRILFLFMIAYNARNDPTISLFAALGVFAVVQLFSDDIVKDEILSIIG